MGDRYRWKGRDPPSLNCTKGLFAGLVPEDRGTKVILVQEWRIKPEYRRSKSVGQVSHNLVGNEIIQDLGVQEESSLTLSGPDLPKQASSAYTQATAGIH